MMNRLWHQKRMHAVFIIPLMVVIAIISLELLIQFLFQIILTNYSFYSNLIPKGILEIIVSQLICIIIIVVFITPLINTKSAGIKNARKSTIALGSVVFSIFSLLILFCIVLCSVITFILGQDIDFNNFFSLLGTIESISALPPWINKLVFLITIIIYTELLFRKTLLPLLEQQGLSPLLSAIISSVAFALFLSFHYIILAIYRDIPIPSVELSIITIIYFFYGLASGLTYIFTRNLTFCILIVFLQQFVIYLGITLITVEEGIFLWISWFIGSILVISGSISILQVIQQIFSIKKIYPWQLIVSEKSKVPVFKGISKFVLALAFFLLISLITVLNYNSNNWFAKILSVSFFLTSFILSWIYLYITGFFKKKQN